MNHRLLKVLIGTALGLILPSGTELAAAGNDPYIVTRWSIADGLPQSSPNALAIDQQGYLWVGTELGLARFDGTNFRVWDTRHGLPGERVTRLLTTPNGLWVGTEPAALSVFRGGQFEVVLEDQSAHALLQDRNGRVWVATPTRLLRSKADTPYRLNIVGGSPRAPTALWEEPDGAVLVAASGGLFRCAPGDDWAALDTGELELPISGLARIDGALVAAAQNGFWRRGSDGWHAIEQARLVRPDVVVDEAGIGWLWSRESGLRRFAGGVLEQLPSLGDQTRLIFSVLPEGADTLWLGVGDQGLVRLRRPLFEALTMGDGLPARAVHGVIQDRNGAIWVGSLEAGVTRIDENAVTHFGVDEGLPGPAVMALAESGRGEIWVATTHGLAVLRGETFEPVLPRPPAPQQPSIVAEILPEPDGGILFAQNGGVFRYHDGRTEEILPEGTAAENEFLHRDAEGDVWIGGRNLCSVGARGAECHALGQEMPQSYARCAFDVPGGGLWFCTYGAGLCRFAAGDAVQCISESQGLPHRTVHNILVDDLGWAWLPSNRGLARVGIDELQRAFDDPGHALRADTFGLDDGLPDLEFNGGVPPRGIVMRDGRLALPTMGGLVLADPDEVAAVTESAPHVDVVGLVVNGVELALAPQLNLAPGVDRIEFHYTAVLPRDPENVRFRYQLLGNDDTWLAAGGTRTATYTGLKPGRYRFQVEASAGSSAWSEPAVLALSLTPHFWQTWWFVILVAAGALTLAAYLVHMRVQRAVELERLRLRIATDLHDDLGSELSGISLASALLQDNADLPESTRSKVEEIRSTTGQLLPRMRDIVWLIDPEKEGAGPLVERLRTTAESLTSGMELEFTSNVEGRRLRLGMAERRDLLLLYREILTNVARHAKAETVRVRLDLAPDRLTVEVHDDGRGFDSSREFEGSGLRNMRMRAHALDARFELVSEPGVGTTVRLTVPLTRSGRRQRRRRDPV